MRKTPSLTLSALVGIATLLVGFGIVMMASSSSVRGFGTAGHDPQFFLKRQLVWLLVSLPLAMLVIRFDYHWLQRITPCLAVISVVLLALVFVPGIGKEVNGAKRWIGIGPLQFQPSEMAKFTAVIAMAAWMTHVKGRVVNLREGFFIPLSALGLSSGLLLLEPDYGTTALVVVVGMCIMFAAGTRLLHLALLGGIGVCGLTALIMQNPLRLGRILAFLWPEQYTKVSYHLLQSKIAFIIGQLTGVGLGDSMQKQCYLPEPHTDFILAIIGEELGFLATGAVLLLFMGLFVCGMIISLKALDPFGRLLAFGMTMLVSLQAAINIGVVTGCLPTKGLPLPFISYGGSSLMMSILTVSVLANVAVHGADRRTDPHTRLIKDKLQRV